MLMQVNDLFQWPGKLPIYKTISSVDSFLIFLVLAIIAGTEPSSGYEISIYFEYTWYFWLIISFLLASPLIAIILGKKTGKIQFFYINLTIFFALLSIIVLFSIPAFRGYPFYGAGDTHSHLGFIKDISLDGYYGIENPYPGIHILICLLANISSCSPETISLFIPQIFFALYIAAIFLLTRALKCGHIECLSITSLAILPSFGYWLTSEYIMPSTDSFILIPLVLFCVIRARLEDNGSPYSILSVLLLVLFPFFHIESTLFLFIALIGLSIFLKRNDAYIPTIILFVGCFAWFSSTLAFGVSIRDTYNAIVLGLVPATPPLQAIVSEGFHIYIIDVILGIIRMYGPALLYLVIGGSLSLLELVKFVSKKIVLPRDIYLSALLSIYGILNFIFLFKGSNMGFHIYRQIKYSLMISVFIIGLFISGQFISKNRKVAYHLLLSLFIIAISILMVYSMYPSSTTYAVNYQPTYSDIAGMNFFFNYRNDTFLIMEPIYRAYQTRWSDLLNTGSESAIRWGYNEFIRPPYHFGYNNSYGRSNLGDFYNYDQYLLIYPPCEIYYTTLFPNYPDHWDFSPEDFKSLNADQTVNNIYSNYALKIMLVRSK